MSKLRDQNDSKNESGHHKADDVHRTRAKHLAAFTAILWKAQAFIPVTDHSQLGKRKRNEDTNDIELDQSGHARIKKNHQCRGAHSKGHDAIGVRQAVTALVKLTRQEGVTRKNRGQGWEAVESGVCRKDQNKARHCGYENKEK